MPKQRTIRRQKKRFSGNRYTNSKKTEEKEPEKHEDSTEQEHVSQQASTSRRSISSQKLFPQPDSDDLKPSPDEKSECNEVYVTGYRFCDMDIVSSAFSLLRCADCGHFSVTLMENHLNRKGCASNLRLLCENCGWKHEFFTSKRQTKSFEVNGRLVYSMRSLGKGHSGAKKFCTLMNMPPPPTARAYAKNSRTITKHIKNIAMECMINAGKEIGKTKGAEENKLVNCGVSCDGTWQRRGYSSNNGCVTAISIDTGKVLDTEALTLRCKQCQLHAHLDKESEEYTLWRADHNHCKSNYKGSAPSMEPEGTERIFRRSVETHKLRYSDLYGDGDSKSFKQIKDVYQDDGITVVKKECIGHVQKRVGTALRKMKKETHGLGGKGKLTDAMIDKLQNYYGIAIRSNVGNLDAMKKAVLASMFHCASNKDRPLHDNCPEGTSSWCKYQQGVANGNKRIYKHGAGLPAAIIHQIKPVYQRLSDDDLLGKCLHGKTQNQNECLNGMIWQRIPKEVFVGKELLELGMYDAVAHFNMGAKTVIQLYTALNIVSGKYTEDGCKVLDMDRVRVAEWKERDASKTRRRILRGLKKKKEDKKIQSEGTTYAAGGF